MMQDSIKMAIAPIARGGCFDMALTSSAWCFCLADDQPHEDRRTMIASVWLIGRRINLVDMSTLTLKVVPGRTCTMQ